MSRTSKFDYQAAIESNLILWPDGLTLDELLERSALEVDRSTLFRHLSRMIQRGRAERTGKARASRYRLLDAPSAKPETRLQDTALPAPQRPKSDQQSAAPAAAGEHEPQRAEPDPIPAAPHANSPTAPEGAPPPALPETVPATPPAPPPFTAAPPPSAQSARLALETSRHGPLVLKAVRRVVRERRRFNPVNLDIYLSLLVPREELDEFSAVVRRELAGLSADNLHRFDLSPAEFSGYTPLEDMPETSDS